MSRSFKLGLSCMLLALITCFSIKIVEASIYMPNNRDDKYTYIGGYGQTIIAQVSSYRGKKWCNWTEFAGLGPLWVWTSKNNEKVRFVFDGRNQLLADFHASIGENWLVDIGVCNRNINVTLAARDETVKVPAGTFEDCIQLVLETSGADCGVISIWFAPNVGIVKWLSQSIVGPIAYELKEGVVGGITYPKPPSLGLLLKGGTDHFVYYINMMPPIPPDFPPTLLHGTFSIDNNGVVCVTGPEVGNNRITLIRTDTRIDHK